MMKSLLSRAFLLLLFLVSSSFAGVILEAEGSGKDIKSAKKEALSQLSALIEVKIDATNSSTLKSSSVNGKEKSSRQIKQSSTLKTSSYLVGVEYEEVLQAPNDPVRYRAILSDEALVKSIKTLNDALGVDLDSLSTKEMQQLLKKSEFLLVLLGFNADIVNKKDIMKKRDYLFNALHKSRLFFNVTPKDATILVDNRVYENGKTHFLDAGKHSVVVKKENYVTYSKTVYTQLTKKKSLNVELIKKSSLPSSVALRGAAAFQRDIKRELLKYNISVNESANESMELLIRKQFVTEVSGIKIYNLRITVDLKRDNTLIISKTGKLKSVPDSQLQKKELALIKAIIKAELKALSKK